MSRLNSKLVLKAEKGQTQVGGPTVDTFVIVKTVNTLDHGIPGDTLDRETVDKILKAANTSRPGKGTLTVEFVK